MTKCGKQWAGKRGGEVSGAKRRGGEAAGVKAPGEGEAKKDRMFCQAHNTCADCGKPSAQSRELMCLRLDVVLLTPVGNMTNRSEGFMVSSIYLRTGDELTEIVLPIPLPLHLFQACISSQLCQKTDRPCISLLTFATGIKRCFSKSKNAKGLQLLGPTASLVGVNGSHSVHHTDPLRSYY